MQLSRRAVVVGHLLVVAGMAWSLAVTVRTLLERDRRLTAALRRQQAERAANVERLRAARALHDEITHQISIISVQAGLAGYVFESDPATARAALDTVADTSREALGEMRRLLAMLDTGPEEDTG